MHALDLAAGAAALGDAGQDGELVGADDAPALLGDEEVVRSEAETRRKASA